MIPEVLSMAMALITPLFEDQVHGKNRFEITLSGDRCLILTRSMLGHIPISDTDKSEFEEFLKRYEYLLHNNQNELKEYTLNWISDKSGIDKDELIHQIIRALISSDMMMGTPLIQIEE